MTSIAGYDLKVTPCCGKTYSTPRYRSMNFMAWEHWTDGYRHGSLMPNDHGLRQCNCGNFYLRSELQWISQVEETEVPYTTCVAPEDLPKAIVSARTAEIELAARLDLWQHLNHTYRESYRAHRDAEEAATEAAWTSANPDRRTWWQRLRKVPPPKYVMAADRPFTYPPYELSEAQRDNLNALLRLQDIESVHIDNQARAEMHRELGQFEQAMQALEEKPDDEQNMTQQLLKRLINDREVAPMRYRM